MLDEVPIEENPKTPTRSIRILAFILFAGIACLFFYLAYKALTIVRF